MTGSADNQGNIELFKSKIYAAARDSENAPMTDRLLEALESDLQTPENRAEIALSIMQFMKDINAPAPAVTNGYNKEKTVNSMLATIFNRYGQDCASEELGNTVKDLLAKKKRIAPGQRLSDVKSLTDLANGLVNYGAIKAEDLAEIYAENIRPLFSRFGPRKDTGWSSMERVAMLRAATELIHYEDVLSDRSAAKILAEAVTPDSDSPHLGWRSLSTNPKLIRFIAEDAIALASLGGKQKTADNMQAAYDQWKTEKNDSYGPSNAPGA